MSNGSNIPAPLIVENSGRWLGNDGSWSAFYVHIGTPPQSFHVLPSFKGQTIYVPIDQDCQRLNVTNCGGTRGVEIFDSRPSDGFQLNRSSTWEDLGVYRVGIGANLGLTGNGQFGYDTAGPGSGGDKAAPKLNRQAVSAYAAPDIWVGQLGLSMFALNMTETEHPSSFLSSLKEGGMISSLSFGYQAGAPYRFTKVTGSLILGGYDRSRTGNQTLLVPAVEDLIVGLQSITASSSNGTTTLLKDGILATIDTAVPELWLPASVCDAFASAFGLTYNEASDRYALLDSTHTNLRELALTFTLKIGTSISGGEAIDINIPYTALDLQADYPIFASRTNYFPIRRAANETQFILGRVFLQEVYLAADWEREVFNISQAVFSAPMPEPDIVSIEPKNETSPLIQLPGPKPGMKLSTGAIAGIAVGAVIVILLLGASVWFFVIRRRKASKLEEAAPTFDDEKKASGDDAPEAVQGRENEMRTNLELVGRPIAELSAPHGNSEILEYQEKVTSGEVVEADGTSPIYELPSPGER